MITTVRQTLEVQESHALGRYREAWDELALGGSLPSPFLQSWWLEGTGGSHDHYLLVLDGETLVGGLALERHRILGVDHFRTLSGGKLCPDHIDLVTRPDRADDVVAAIREWCTRPGSRILDLEGVVEDSLVARALSPTRIDLVDVAPHEHLTGTFDDYLAARSKSCRKRTQRFQRSADRAGMVLRRLGADEIEAGLDAFEALHAPRADRRALMREILRIRKAVLQGAARDQVRLYVAELDGRTGAVLVAFTTGGRLSTYQTARSLDREFNHVGSVVEAFAIADACESRMTDLDLLRGAEPYKRSLVSAERQLLRVRTAHGPRGRAVLRLLVGVEELRARASRLVRAMQQKFRKPTDQTGSGSHQ